MSHDNLSRGVPVQHLLENQDASVLYSIDEVTGIVTPIERDEPAPAKGKKKRAATAQTAEPTPSVPEEVPSDPGAGE